MEQAFTSPRFTAYLVVSIAVLVALAALGPVWFVSGIAAFAAFEITASLRDGDALRGVAAITRR